MSFLKCAEVGSGSLYWQLLNIFNKFSKLLQHMYFSMYKLIIVLEILLTFKEQIIFVGVV